MRFLEEVVLLSHFIHLVLEEVPCLALTQPSIARAINGWSRPSKSSSSASKGHYPRTARETSRNDADSVMARPLIMGTRLAFRVP